jgi:hypothetical protein
MRATLIIALALTLPAGAALAQGTSSGSGTGTGTTGTSPGRAPGGAPALNPVAPGGVSPKRTNPENFPPSRLLQPPQGTTQGTTPGGSGNPPAGSTTSTGGISTTAPGGTQTTQPGTNQTQTDPTGTQLGTQANPALGITGNDPQTTPGQAAPGKRIEPNSQTSSGSPTTSRTGKNPTNVAISDCMKLWDAGTHMSKADWERTCRRVQNRLNDAVN